MSFTSAGKAPGVYITEVPSGSMPIQGVGTAVAAFVGVTAQRPASGPAPVHIANWTQFKNTFGGLVQGAYLPYAVYGFFQNQGGRCYIASVGTVPSPKELPPGKPAAPRAELKDDKGRVALVVEWTGPAPDKQPTVEVADAPAGGDPDDFSLIARVGDQEAKRWDVNLKRVATAAQLSRTFTDLLTVTPGSEGVGLRPTTGTYTLPVSQPVAATTAPTAKDYIGDKQARTGLKGIEAIDEVTMIAVPDIFAAGADDTLVKTVQEETCAQCELLCDRMAILDPPSGLNFQEMQDWRSASLSDEQFATLYYPWIKIYDPDSNKPLLVPPSGHMAGIWSRTDNQRGVWKAPANEEVIGALALERQVTEDEQGALNDVGVNVIRSFPGRGIRVWGARTLQAEDWKYINVRRLFNYIEESIKHGTAWVVFEPNDQDLWQRIIRTVSSFLLGLWRDGALFGAKPELAFYVKCDAETNPPDVIDAGQVVIEIGIAPVKPAEFVVFKIQQTNGGALVSE